MPTADSAPDIDPLPTRTPLTRLTESLEQEGSFLNVPLNHYKNMIGTKHRFEKNEMNAIISAVTEAVDDDNLSADDAVRLLESLVSRLASFKAEVFEQWKKGQKPDSSFVLDRSLFEHLQAERFMTRLNHINSANLVTFPHWKTLRMNRILVDYLLRMSYRDTATRLALSTDTLMLIDLEEFDEARKVISALQNKDVAPALVWCDDNKSESKLELGLRLQEFVELVRAENNSQALTYARTYLTPWGTTHMKDVQRVLTTLAFRSNTQCAKYKVLFEAKQWDYLVEQFKQEFYKLYGMTYEPLLYIYLQAGLCALKTPLCSIDDCKKADPLSQESLRILAEPLPFTMPFSKQHPEQKLVCYITGELMGPGNQPAVLPNGYIYSAKACTYMMQRNNGNITCPRTGAVCRAEDVAELII